MNKQERQYFKNFVHGNLTFANIRKCLVHAPFQIIDTVDYYLPLAESTCYEFRRGRSKFIYVYFNTLPEYRIPCVDEEYHRIIHINGSGKYVYSETYNKNNYVTQRYRDILEKKVKMFSAKRNKKVK